MEPDDSHDCYEILQVSRRAEPLIITKAYRLLAAIYHPDNKETGNEGKFHELVDAYRRLIDPVRRAAYDRTRYGSARAKGSNGRGTLASDPTEPVTLAQDEREMRRLALQALYNNRRNRPSRPGLSLQVIAELLGSHVEDAQFTLWYLRGKKFVEFNDDDGIAITVAGVDYLEASEVEAAPGAVAQQSLPHNVEEVAKRPVSRDPDHTPSEAPDP